MSANPLHSSKSNEWYTPADWMQRVRNTLGYIELDPASCEEANRTVGAARWYGIEDDGLTQPWECSTLFLNPPGGRGNARRWWTNLVERYEDDSVGSAIYLAFSLEHLLFMHANSVEIVRVAVPPRRIKFNAKGSPTHGNAFVLLSVDEQIIERFDFQFSDCLVLR